MAIETREGGSGGLWTGMLGGGWKGCPSLFVIRLFANLFSQVGFSEIDQRRRILLSWLREILIPRTGVSFVPGLSNPMRFTPATTSLPPPCLPPSPHTYSVTPAPSPLPSNQILSPHLPTLTPTSAHASSSNLPPNASLTAPWPTPFRLHSTGSLGVTLAPGGTSKGRS